MALIKKLTKIGNSYGVILPRQALKISRIDPRRGCSLSIEENRLVLVPVNRKKTFDEEVSEAMLRFMQKYRSDLQKLGGT